MTTYTDYKLRFADLAAYEEAFESLDWPVHDDVGALLTYPTGPGYFAVTGISVIDTPGEYDDEGNETTPPVFKPGYHVDLRMSIALPDVLAPHVVTPEQPAHEFF